jgi:hypothetical protein
MKHTGKHFLYLIFFVLYFLSSAQAQTSFVSPTLSVEPNSVFKADIKVASFSNIVGTQFTMIWDSTVLRFKGLRNLSMDLTEIDHFGINQTGSGVLTFSWFDNQLSGVSLGDSAILFSIEFEAIGAPNSLTLLSFSDDPTVREVADTSFTAIPAGFYNGVISLLGTTSSRSEDISGVMQVAAFPNPFTEATRIELITAYAVNARISIVNSHGQLIYERAQDFESGAHVLTFSRSDFSAPGVYYLTIAAPEVFVTQRLILVK